MSARYFYVSIYVSINEVHMPRAIFPIKVFYKKYVLIYSITDIFYVYSFSIKLANPLKIHICKQLAFFRNYALLQ